ncbi:YkgJ family cysteine cluster protein [Desulfopila inferna]|uniref:YkgJ family cysteine cluster protein n=1 Tax=Desulfopila inferna TaxID=468528 RepID=UPI0019661CB4|nr:hypothetical protein [Desulfopila inferna]MBM9603908.1 hypothetical protein [Desulfopila inferna]
MKVTILDTIYAVFAEWSPSEQFCCAPGCASCCTRNVTITALEGRQILNYCREMKGREWLVRLFDGLHPADPALQTTNEYVEDILHNRQNSENQAKSSESCPFLEGGRCSIYPVRPFSCRCFFSTILCGSSGAATIPDVHLYGSMAMMQLIEHLGQFDHWGNMVDVLVILVNSPEYAGSFEPLDNQELLQHARTQVHRALPLPGFILPPAEKAGLDQLLRTIFETRLGRTTIEQILNGR